ncbi:MAG: Holliday junction resolvase RuvX [Solirubrobacterales bacterium]|nr:Holliday junction resolvase RuvX [Solirubrobacterales bacterium]HMT04845.1 Holliday junction resolvase RuvX [Solirubrobacterales bacterium]
MRVLALDYGMARIGCAISDPTGTLATPIAAIEPPEVGTVAKVASDREAEKIVVGLPVSLSGEDSEQTGLTRSFARDLEKAVEVPVETWDERFTTRMAARTRRDTGAGSAEDSIAAAHLLESYLQAASREAGE